MKKYYWILLSIIVIVGLIIILVKKQNNATLLLEGDTIIAIKKNESFVEPGYEIKGDKLDGLYVKVENNVNSQIPGSYIVKYYLYNKENQIIYETLREIRVLENNDELIITLKGDRTEYFFVNDYQELGATATINGVDATNEIKINSNVNEKMVGNYQVIYEIEKNGQKKTTTRNVKIIDLLVKENIDYVKNNINLIIDCENYDYTLLPNGNKVYAKTVNYTFTKGFSYTFNIYLKNGSHKKYLVEVKDNTGPTGTCTVKASANNTIVSVDSYDEDGILKYSYNGIDYYTNNFSVSGINSNMVIRVYDKLNNYTDITCSAKIDSDYKTTNLSNTYASCNTNWTNANAELDNLMRFYGYKTRDAVVAAALYLTNFQYKISYSWGGKYLEKGLNPKWGCKTEVTKMVCSNQIGSNTCELGLDCSGFTAWAYAQAGFDKNILVTHAQSTSMWGNFDASKHKYSFKNNQDKVSLIKVGDIVHIEGHVGIVIGMDDKTLQVANEREGIRVSIINKTNGKSINNDKDFENFVLFDDFFKMYGN